MRRRAGRRGRQGRKGIPALVRFFFLRDGIIYFIAPGRSSELSSFVGCLVKSGPGGGRGGGEGRRNSPFTFFSGVPRWELGTYTRGVKASTCFTHYVVGDGGTGGREVAGDGERMYKNAMLYIFTVFREFHPHLRIDRGGGEEAEA